MWTCRPDGVLFKLSPVVLLAVWLTVTGCDRRPHALKVEEVETPAPAGSIMPQTTMTSAGELILSWMEPLPGGGYSFQMSTRIGNSWSSARTISGGPDISMFSADLPGVAQFAGGPLLAYWEVRDMGSGDKYATSVQTSESEDDGQTWSSPRCPYDHAPSGQHSFLSAFPTGNSLGLVWLDAQERSFIPARNGQDPFRQGAIGLRYVAVNKGGQTQADSFIDPITCECCPTASTVTRRGPVVVYRGRAEAPGTKPDQVEYVKPAIRDIYIARLGSEGWSKPHLIHADNWVIDACPDNGPAVDAIDDELAVAWWTQAGAQYRVNVAFSKDAGDNFGSPIRVDDGAPDGQVTVSLLDHDSGAVVGWLDGGKVWARRVAKDGKLGTPIALGVSPRHSRLPRWIAVNNEVIAPWTQLINGEHSVRVTRIIP